MSTEREHEPLDQRTQLMMSKSEVAAVDEWAWSKRIRARSEAIRRLLELGLAADASGWSPEAPPKKAPKKAPAKKGQA